VNTVGTPTTALLITALVAIALTGVGSFDKLFALTAFLSVLVDVAAFGTLFVLRRREPDRTRPFKAWGYPFLPAIVLIGAIVLLIAFVVSSTQNSLFALIGIALSYPVYLVVKKLVKPRPG
jgi:APA family basic amino acid/polyamine antiporter